MTRVVREEALGHRWLDVMRIAPYLPDTSLQSWREHFADYFVSPMQAQAPFA